MDRDFKDRFEWRVDSPYNGYTSFTMGRALKEYMQQTSHIEDGSRLKDGRYVREMIQQGVASQYGIDIETVETFPYSALLELCDISILQEIGETLYFNEEESGNGSQAFDFEESLPQHERYEENL